MNQTKNVSLNTLPTAAAPAQRLRLALKNALQEAMLGVSGLGLLACATGEPLGVEKNGGGAGGGGVAGMSGGTGGDTGAGGMGGMGGIGGIGGMGGVGGMGGGTVTVLPTANFEPRTCVQANGTAQWNPLPGLKPNPAADYMLFAGFGTTFETGTACATATSPQVCNEELQAAKATITPNRCFEGGCMPVFLATRTDGFVHLQDQAAVVNFLKPIDSADEAALIVRMSGFFVGCTVEAGGVKTLPGGVFEIRAVQHRFDCETEEHLLRVKADGTVEKLEAMIPPPNTGCAVGRMPSGLYNDQPLGEGPQDLCTFLAESARLEAASVPAFLILARDLYAANAPEHLVTWALRAAGDEVAHATSTASLAQTHGGRLGNDLHIGLSAPKTLFELARENIVEGCVRETFGALVAAYQAQNASDPQIAATMRTIAQDEADHAALGHEVNAWLQPLLSPEQRAQIEQARQEAIASFAQALAPKYNNDVFEAAGFPRPEVAAKLHASLFQQLA